MGNIFRNYCMVSHALRFNSDDVIVNTSVVISHPRLFLKGVLIVKEMVVRHVIKT